MRRTALPTALLIAAAITTGCKDTSATTSAPAAHTVPRLIGETLSSAENDAKAVGFPDADSHDLAGDRMQIIDSNWKVCTQTPAPGTQATSTKVHLGVVKTSEACPAASPSASPSPSPSATLTAHPTAATHAPAVHHTHHPSPSPTATTDSPSDTGASDGSAGVLLSPSGNYYRAGEFCPHRYIGMSTVDSHGRTITCVFESGGYHWHY